MSHEYQPSEEELDRQRRGNTLAQRIMQGGVVTGTAVVSAIATGPIGALITTSIAIGAAVEIERRRLNREESEQ